MELSESYRGTGADVGSHPEGPFLTPRSHLESQKLAPSGKGKIRKTLSIPLKRWKILEK